MRFAGQRFRQGKFKQPREEAESGYIGRAAYRPQIQGLEQSMAQMPQVTAQRFVKTEEPPFQGFNGAIGEFRK